MSNTFWLKNGKLILDGGGKIIQCGTCPCVGALCSAGFTLNMENDIIDTTIPSVIHTSRYRANTIATGREAICNIALLASIPAGGQITQVQVTSEYKGTGDGQNTATFYADNITSSINGNTVSLNIAHALKSLWFRPYGRHYVDFTFTVLYRPPSNNNGTCAVSMISSSTRLGNDINGSFFKIGTTAYGGGGYFAPINGSKTGWDYYPTYFFGVPVGAGSTPPAGTKAYDFTATDISYLTLGANRAAWYDDVTPVAYNEIQNDGNSLVAMDSENIVELIDNNTSTLCRAFMRLHPTATTWTNSRNPSQGDTTYYTSGGSFVSSSATVDWNEPFSAGWNTTARNDYCQRCDNTRGGIMTVPEEFE